MKKRIFFILLVTSVWITNQAQVIFKYDEGGNQVYRGENKPVMAAAVVEENKPQEILTSLEKSEEDRFWEGIRMYPVPVKDVLTIEWNDENDKLISHITLYQHSTLGNVFTKQNIPNINKRVEINMSRQYMGVYVVKFQLKNGKVISKNIIKE